MDQKMRLYLFVGGCVSLALLVGYIYRYVSIKEKKAEAQLKQEYQAAIAAGDRTRALELGRKYYSKLRGGVLSIYDEQAIANDLSTIK
ncbi:MAG: hypothetical protein JWQ27_2685 [Ferruginibacter sp.]|nr:hypothetical protein [Ferruginibacter sp.]